VAARGFVARWKWRLLRVRLRAGGGRRLWAATPRSEARPSCARGAALHKIRDPKRGEASQHLGPRQASLLV